MPKSVIKQLKDLLQESRAGGAGGGWRGEKGGVEILEHEVGGRQIHKKQSEQGFPTNLQSCGRVKRKSGDRRDS